MRYYLNVLKTYNCFTGRISKNEYWMFVLFNFIFCVAAFMLDNILGLAFKLNGTSIGYGYIYLAYIFSTITPGLSVSVRRLHDVNKSGTFLLVGLIPIAGAIWLLVLFCTDGSTLPNKYDIKEKAY